MKRHPIDKLFSERLTEHTLTAPPGAWTKINAGLATKASPFTVYRVAASLLLLCVLSAVLVWFLNHRGETPSQLTQHQSIPQKDSPSTKPEIKPVPAITRHLTARKKVTPPSTVLKKTPAFIQQDPVATYALTTPPVVPADSVTPSPGVKEVTLVAIAPVSEKPIVIEYRLEPVKRSTWTTEAVAKEKTPLQKVLDFAVDAKNSHPMANLRVAKDDLFALNFKKDKQKKR